MRRISKQTWDQIKVAYASGIGLRELARRMNLPEGTVLAYAKRHGWTQQIEEAKAVVLQPQSDAITASPMQSAVHVMQDRAERYRQRMADVSEKVTGHLETMGPDDILHRASQLERFDTVARRTFGLNEAPPSQASLSLNILTNHSAVQVIADSGSQPRTVE